jgi:Flp pilus assembly protein TadD
MTVYFSLCTLLCMRPFHYLLLLALYLLLKPVDLRAAIYAEKADSLPQLQDLIESEFAFQNGSFNQAFAYYKQRPLASFSQQELTRGAELALATGDFEWLQLLLISPAGKSSQQQEILKIKLAQSIQLGQTAQIQQAWQGLVRLSDSQGIEQAQDIIFRYSPEYQSTLNSALELYATQTDLKNSELFQLFQYAWQWQLDTLATSLQKRLKLNTPEAILANTLSVCKEKIQVTCVQKLEKLNPSDFDENQKLILLELARKSDSTPQLNRWLVSLPQNGNSYYQRIALLGKSMDNTKADTLVSEIERDADLNTFQRAILLGSLAELQKRWPEAEGFYQQALLQKTPTTAAIRYAVVLFRQNKNALAFDYLEKIQNDDSFSDEIRREAFLTEVQFYSLKSSKLNEQNKNVVYQRALAIWPLAHRIRYEYAMRLLEQGNTKESVEQLLKILKYSPTDANVLNAYGYSLVKDFNRPRAAYKPIEQAYLIAPNRAEILDSYGYVLHRLGRNAEALPPLQKAWNLTPTAVTAAHLAQVYWQLGDKVQANVYFQKGLSLDKNELELLQFKELLP